VLGRLLFRWRGVIGFLAFGVVFWLARPTFGSCLLGLPMVLAGFATRFWASGYIGIEGRVREIGASRRIVSGPYRLFRHPLYIGNFLLVTGMLVALRPAWWMGAVVMAGFVVEYAAIVVEEERDLSAERSQSLESRSESAEVQVGSERTANGDRREARGESFLLSRALVEWRTWVVTGVAWGLAMLKALAATRGQT
jgi:isoprenylcysteine carboxyl methyltransferase (ICMT) family protein YpbQ